MINFIIMLEKRLKSELEKICEKNDIVELSLFGSYARGDIKEGSDVDILLEFKQGKRIGYFKLCEIQSELENVFKRPVDVLTKKGLKRSTNFYRVDEILNTSVKIYG